MKNFITLVVVLAFAFCTFPCQSKAASSALCVTTLLKTKQLKGVATDKNGNVFPNVKLELLKNNSDEVLGSVITDAKGRFDFGQIKSGRYEIRARNDFASSFSFEVKHKSTSKLKTSEPELKITVGLEVMGGCRGWSAIYGTQET